MNKYKFKPICCSNILLLTILVSFGCKDSTTPIIDPIASVVGLVIDSSTSLPIDSVTVGWKTHYCPDSLLIIDGKLNMDSILDIRRSGNEGIFRFDFFLCPALPYPYEDMFAYKRNYRLWRFNNQWNSLIRLNQSVDSITIKLVQ